MTPLTNKQEGFARAYVELGNARQAYAMAGYSQNNSLATQQKEAHKLLRNPKVAPRIRELQAIARRRAEAEYGVTVDSVSRMLLDIYESGTTRPAGKIRAITSLAKLHGLM
jgi:phage terminase small subunit